MPRWFGAVRLCEKYHTAQGFGCDFSQWHWCVWAEIISLAEGLAYDENHFRELNQKLLIEEEEELRKSEEYVNQSAQRKLDFALAHDDELRRQQGAGDGELPDKIVLPTRRTPNRAERAAMLAKKTAPKPLQ